MLTWVQETNAWRDAQGQVSEEITLAARGFRKKHVKKKIIKDATGHNSETKYKGEN